MITREIAMTEHTRPAATARFTAAQRLRRASLAYNVGTLLIFVFPSMYTFGQFIVKNQLLLPYFLFLLAIWGWGIVVLARDQRLKVLMALGSRSNREAVARSLEQASRSNPAPRKVVLDEFDFHLRSEAFRISYQIIASLVAGAAIMGFLTHAFTDIQMNWNTALMLTFPFGILWLLALPTSVVVWLDNPAADSDGEQP